MILFLIAKILVFLFLLLFLLFLYITVLRPPSHPQNIPAIPFWVALLPFFKRVDQSEIFACYLQEPLRKHGAVKLFFGARWNVLVHRPAYLAEIFREEDLYQKSGNQKKIPHSVIASYLGDNIISAHGEVWKGYKAVVKPGLQRNDFDVGRLSKNAETFCQLLTEAQGKAGDGGGVAVQDLLQRYSVANCSEVVLQTDFDALSSPNASINLLQTAVKLEIFKPIFLNFPILDRLPFPSRQRARETVNKFRQELRRGLVDSHRHNDGLHVTLIEKGGGLGRRMLDARESGKWSEKQLLDNLAVAFVAGQENPQLCLISTLYLLAKHSWAQARLHDEISTLGDDCALRQNQEALATKLPFLTSVIYESLRLFPPIGQLVNRKTADHALLGGSIMIPRNTYVGYNCYSTNRDPSAWGPTADMFDPSRWGTDTATIQKQYRQRRMKAEFISFHGGRRACLGERFAMLELRVTLVTLVRTFTWVLDPSWVDRKTPAGPLYPWALRLVFTRRSEKNTCGIIG
ncbi:cytochrome P450-DIT2 [Podospora australis]|uniref:Cytochrome P450-DIT2 n=1 Tax=Podospora australis TaxID=1536484 RepID=A0AAN7AF61_9PEZI|nr:cytochrome P450-DIT2 [Podospora australis]